MGVPETRPRSVSVKGRPTVTSQPPSLPELGAKHTECRYSVHNGVWKRWFKAIHAEDSNVYYHRFIRGKTDALPPGWTEHMAKVGQWNDVEPGRTYYYNKEKNEYTLTKPVIAIETVAELTGEDKKKCIKFTEECIELRPYTEPRILNGKPVFIIITADLAEARTKRHQGITANRDASKQVTYKKGTVLYCNQPTCPKAMFGETLKHNSTHTEIPCGYKSKVMGKFSETICSGIKTETQPKNIKLTDVDSLTDKPEEQEQLKKVYFPQGTKLQCNVRRCNSTYKVWTPAPRPPFCGKRKRGSICTGVLQVTHFPAGTKFKCDQCTHRLSIDQPSLPPTHEECTGKLQLEFPAGTAFKCDKCSSKHTIRQSGLLPTCRHNCVGTMQPVKVDSRRRLIERFIRESERCIAS